MEFKKQDGELSEEELMEVRAGMPIDAISAMNVPISDDGELTLDELDNVYGGPNLDGMYEKALEHSSLHRQSEIEKLKVLREQLQSDGKSRSGRR